MAVSLTGLHLEASVFSIGMMLSLYSLVPMFVLVAAGRWVDRVGVRRPIMQCMTLATFGLFVPVLVFDLGALFLAPICIGLGYMPMLLCTQRMVGQADSDDERKRNFAMLSLAFSVSGFIGPVLTGFLIDSVGHRWTFAVLGGIMLLAFAGFYRFDFPDLPIKESIPNQDQPSVTELLRTPELRRLYLSVVLICAAWDVHQFLIPIYGVKQGLSATQIGLVLGAFGLATFAVRTVLPFLAKLFDEWVFILSSMLVAAVVYSLYPWAKTLPNMLVLAALLGLGLGLAQPMVMSVMYKASPPDRIGEAAGLRLTLVNASQTILPMMTGAFGVLGVAGVFWVLAAALLAGFGFVQWSRKNEPFVSETSSETSSETREKAKDDLLN